MHHVSWLSSKYMRLLHEVRVLAQPRGLNFPFCAGWLALPPFLPWTIYTLMVESLDGQLDLLFCLY